MVRKHTVWSLIVTALIVAVLGGYSSLASTSAATDSIILAQVTAVPTAAPNVTPAPASQPSQGVIAAFEGTLEQIYSRVSPAVVNIRVTQVITAPAYPDVPGIPFFGPPGSQGQQGQQGQQQYRQGLGSGFLWDGAGHIVTNNHVVAGANNISVVFDDGTIVPASVVGTDQFSDLAVLKVDTVPNNLSPVPVADSAKVRVGQFTIAIGNPFGLEGTMTTGIVSALGRSIPAGENVQGPAYTIPDIIQTDAAINPGNSGGVLLNEAGQLIGVTAAIESPSGASSGIGFAIPSAIVQKVIPALIQTGHYEHPWLGVSGTTLTPELAQAMNLPPSTRGALVVDITSGSPAAQAGLQGSDRQVTINGLQARVGGDVITAINGQPVNSFEDVVSYLTRSAQAGQTITLTVIRNGQQGQVQVTLAPRPTQQGKSGGAPTNGVQLGVAGVTLTPQIAQAMNLPPNTQGVLIEQIESGSPADQAGLNGSSIMAMVQGQQLRVGGDVITGINGQPVTNVEGLRNALQQAQPGQQITLTVIRNGQQGQVQVTLNGQATPTPTP